MSKKEGTVSSPDMPDKIDSEGNYLPFYGYTVICMVSDRIGAPRNWEEFLQKAPILRSHMSPLPASSYHATIYDIFTQRKVPAQYTPKSGLVPSPHWNNAHKILQRDMGLAQAQCEKVKDDIMFLKKKFKIGRHPGSSVVIEGTLSNSKEVTILEGNIQHVFGDVGKPVAVHHITLGYIFKEIGEDDLKSFKEELQSLWDQVEDEILLDKPNVYYFETMEEFRPTKDIL